MQHHDTDKPRPTLRERLMARPSTLSKFGMDEWTKARKAETQNPKREA